MPIVSANRACFSVCSLLTVFRPVCSPNRRFSQLKPLPAVTDRRFRTAATISPSTAVRGEARLGSPVPNGSAGEGWGRHAAAESADNEIIIQESPSARFGLLALNTSSLLEDSDTQSYRSLDEHVKDVLERPPTLEEVKEFCLLSGGGYGETDTKAGKFYIGAFLEPEHWLDDRNGGDMDQTSREVGAGMPHKDTSAVQKKANRVAPAPSMKRIKSSRFSDRLIVPGKGFQEGVLPHLFANLPAFRTSADSSAARQLKEDGSGHADRGSLAAAAEIYPSRLNGTDDWHRVGSFIFNLKRGAKVFSPGERDESDTRLDIRVTLTPPNDMDRPFPDAHLCVSPSEPHQGAPLYCVWNSNGKDAFMPSTVSELVGHVTTPEVGPDNDNFPWKWRKGEVSGGSGQYTIHGMTAPPPGMGSRCAVQLPLLLQSKMGLCNKVRPEERLEALSRLHAWALLHTISLAVYDVKRGFGEEIKYVLHQHRWPMARHNANILSVRRGLDASGDYEVEGLGEARRPYFKEAAIDRDLEFLRCLDPSLSAETIASGNLINLA